MAWWLLCAVCCLAVVVGMDLGAEGDAADASDAADAAAVWLRQEAAPAVPWDQSDGRGRST